MIGVIVEVKKVSLFEGILWLDFDFVVIVVLYEEVGVVCFFVFID